VFTFNLYGFMSVAPEKRREAWKVDIVNYVRFACDCLYVQASVCYVICVITCLTMTGSSCVLYWMVVVQTMTLINNRCWTYSVKLPPLSYNVLLKWVCFESFTKSRDWNVNVADLQQWVQWLLIRVQSVIKIKRILGLFKALRNSRDN